MPHSRYDPAHITDPRAKIDFRTGRIPVGRGMGGTVAVGEMAAAPEPTPTFPMVELPLRLFPPVNWENLDIAGSATLGDQGTTVTILDYVVPIGRNGIINQVGNAFIGGGFQEGQGNVVWRILVDGGTPPGANSYHKILFSLGSPAIPTRIAGFRIFENQRITWVAQNVGIINVGQMVTARLLGYLYPRELEEADIWV